MTRLLALVALSLAMTLAPTPGKAQILVVPEYFNLLDQDQEGDGFIDQNDAKAMTECINKIKKSPSYKNLPKTDKNTLNRLLMISSGEAKEVPAVNPDQARANFKKKNKGREVKFV